MPKTRILALAAACLLAGCGGTAQTNTSTGVYALGTGLDQAEKAALVYEKSPAANPAVVVQIKALDAKAFAVVEPAVAAGNNVTADQLALAQAGLSELTSYLTAAGVH